MSIQSQNLRMTTLEVLNHQPQMSHHPELKDGIHLRWNPGENIDFPWYGYYLLRRNHIAPTAVRCMHAGWILPNRDQIPYISANVGLLPREYMVTQYGSWLSDQRIRLTDDFPPGQLTDNTRMVEVDLQDRNFTNFFFNTPVNNIVLYIGFRTSASVTIAYKLFNNTIVTKVIDGGADQIVSESFSFDAITSITFSGAPAAIVALCHTAANENLWEGWEFIEGLQYPTCLPVEHPNYPCPNKPMNVNAAENLALDRVNYGNPDKWQGSDGPGEPTHVARLHQLLTSIVENGPIGPKMHTIVNSYVEESEPHPGDPESLKMPSQKPMDLILLGALDPAVAQMTGLHFIDETAQEGVAYDYLILADHTGVFQSIFENNNTENGFESYTKTLANKINTSELDGWICFNRSLSHITSLEAPKNLKAYALPGMTVRDEETGLIKNTEERNSAGLTWDLNLTADALLKPDSAVMYELWRHDYGPQQPSIVSNDNTFSLVKQNPFVVVRLDSEAASENETISDYPPFRLLAYDNYVKDGWYSYKLAGRDLFGRYSSLSTASRWHQWSPAPIPKPYYYIDPPGNQQINPFAIELLDLTPPPPPTATEATALDAEDRFLIKDDAYTSWRSSIESTTWFTAFNQEDRDNFIGLRVRWQWTHYHMRQAPLTSGFNIHYHPGYTPPTEAANPAQWNNFLMEVPYENFISETVRGMKDLNGIDLEGVISEGTAASINGNTIRVPIGFDVQLVRRGFEHILLANGEVREIFRIDAVNPTNRELIVNGTPSVGANASWRIGLLLRQYEVFLPGATLPLLQNGLAGLNPALPAPDNFSPTLEFPKCYANIGISTLEQKNNQTIEGNVGASAKIIRVLRSKPAAPPALPPDSDKIFASPADYNANSFYTYRWRPAAFLRTHIYRALEESIFICDYQVRPKIPSDNNLIISTTDDSIFPDITSEPIWDALKRQTIVDELNTLNTITRNANNQQEALKEYRQLSNDGLRILSGLPHVKKAFQQITIQPLDDTDPEIINTLGPDNPDTYSIDPNLRKYIDTLPGKAANRYFYRAAYVDQAENIGAMNLPSGPIYLPDVQPPKKPVITKITAGEKNNKLQWAHQNGRGLSRFLIYATDQKEHTRDIRLMGDPVANLPLACITVDSGQIDLGSETDIVEVKMVYEAQNFDPTLELLTGQTATSFLATPAAPVAGVLNGLTATDGTEVVVVYEDSSGTLQFTACRNLPRCWVHGGLIGGKVYYYRIIVIKTIDLNSNTHYILSRPSVIASAKPYDLAPAEPPIITTIEWIKINDKGDIFPFNEAIPIGEERFSAIRLIWTSSDTNLKSLIQFQNTAFAPFQNGSGWLEKGNYEYIHRNPLDYLDQEYRIKVINEAGNINRSFLVTSIAGN